MHNYLLLGLREGKPTNYELFDILEYFSTEDSILLKLKDIYPESGNIKVEKLTIDIACQEYIVIPEKYKDVIIKYLSSKRELNSKNNKDNIISLNEYEGVSFSVVDNIYNNKILQVVELGHLGDEYGFSLNERYSYNNTNKKLKKYTDSSINFSNTSNNFNRLTSYKDIQVGKKYLIDDPTKNIKSEVVINKLFSLGPRGFKADVSLSKGISFTNIFKFSDENDMLDMILLVNDNKESNDDSIHTNYKVNNDHISNTLELVDEERSNMYVSSINNKLKELKDDPEGINKLITILSDKIYNIVNSDEKNIKNKECNMRNIDDIVNTIVDKVSQRLFTTEVVEESEDKKEDEDMEVEKDVDKVSEEITKKVFSKIQEFKTKKVNIDEVTTRIFNRIVKELGPSLFNDESEVDEDDDKSKEEEPKVEVKDTEVVNSSSTDAYPRDEDDPDGKRNRYVIGQASYKDKSNPKNGTYYIWDHKEKKIVEELGKDKKEAVTKKDELNSTKVVNKSKKSNFSDLTKEDVTMMDIRALVQQALDEINTDKSKQEQALITIKSEKNRIKDNGLETVTTFNNPNKEEFDHSMVFSSSTEKGSNYGSFIDEITT